MYNPLRLLADIIIIIITTVITTIILVLSYAVYSNIHYLTSLEAPFRENWDTLSLKTSSRHDNGKIPDKWRFHEVAGKIIELNGWFSTARHIWLPEGQSFPNSFSKMTKDLLAVQCFLFGPLELGTSRRNCSRAARSWARHGPLMAHPQWSPASVWKAQMIPLIPCFFMFFEGISHFTN